MVVCMSAKNYSYETQNKAAKESSGRCTKIRGLSLSGKAQESCCFERCFISNKVMEIHIWNIFLIYKETLHCLSSKTFFNIILGDRFILELKRNWEGYN